MQTTINADMAVGIPGEKASDRPEYAYAIQTSAAVTFGEPIIIDGGKAKPATGATCDGVAASPHQHVQNALPSSTGTLTVPAGTVISIVERGERQLALYIIGKLRTDKRKRAILYRHHFIKRIKFQLSV